MSLPAYLANIKSSGIYRFVWDKSEIPNATTEVLRLVVGYSERGPFNTPVYIDSQTKFTSIFGGVSKKLERQGCWFHRMALQTLRKGPILCLNLKNFKNESVNAVSFNPQEAMGGVIDLAVKDIYNTNRFWTLEPELLEEIEGIRDDEPVLLSNEYISITATDAKESSNTIFMRGYEPSGYNVSFKEWFSSTLNGTELPSYLEGFENKKLQNYWAEIYVFRGQFTPDIATSDVLCKYFNVEGDKVTLKPYIVNAFGEKKDTLDALAANDASNFIRKYQGILLPEFPSANGSTISLDILFNNDNQIHKMMMRLNQDMLYEERISMDDIDTMNWNIASGISYSNGIDYSQVTPNDVMSIEGNVPVIYEARFNKVIGNWLYGIENLGGIDKNGMPADFYTYDLADLGVALDGDYRLKITGILSGIYGITKSKFSNQYATGEVVYEGLKVINDERFISARVTKNSVDGFVGNIYYIKEEDLEQGTTGLDLYDGNGDPVGITIDLTNLPDPKEVNISDIISRIGLEVGENLYIKGAKDEEDNESPICTITKMVVDGDDLYITFDKNISDATDITDMLVRCAGSVTATSINLVPTYVRGYEYAGAKPDAIPANTGAGAPTDPQMKKNNWVDYQLGILDMKGIRIGLTNRTDVDYRYIVDTFEAFAVPGECHAKLALISKMKFNDLGFINFPNMKSFSKCKTMSFKDENGFDSKYIAMGGNPMVASGGKFTLASEDNGASFVSYNTPVILKDPETGVHTSVPSAALVSNDFLDKFTKYLPYTIIAGPKRGRIQDPDLVGPEFSFGRDDLDNLETMGVNCMVFVPGKGTYINSNQTAKQNPVSALSRIHIRELCTFIQDEIESMMEYYHWDFNTPNLRQTLKDKADTICDTCFRNEGIYDYLNVCDKSNNTDEVIDNEMIILSTSIEPSRGAGKMIQELTLYRTGGLSVAIRDAQ